MFERDIAIKTIMECYKENPSIVRDSFLISVGKLIDSFEKEDMNFKELLESLSALASSNKFAIDMAEDKYKELFN